MGEVSVGQARGTGRVAVLDALRAVAILVVLVYHSRNYTWQLTPVSTSGMRWLYAALAEVFLVPVPAFVMLSGVVMAGRPRPGEARLGFALQRLRRVGIPLVAWSVVAILVTVVVEHAQPPAGGVEWGLDVLLGRRWYPLYFLVVVVQLYALISLMPAAPRARTLLAVAMVALQLLADVVIQGYFLRHPDRLSVVSAQASYFGIFWCGYFGLGILVAPRLAAILRARLEIRIAVSLAALVTFVWLAAIATTAGALSYYQSPIHFVFTAATTLCAAWVLQALPGSWLRALAWLGVASFGIYLCHGLVLPILGVLVPRHWIGGVGAKALLHWAVFAAAGAVGATTLSVLMRRVRVLRPLLGEA